MVGALAALFFLWLKFGKGEDLAKKNEIGTAKYSLTDNNQANNQKTLTIIPKSSIIILVG